MTADDDNADGAMPGGRADPDDPFDLRRFCAKCKSDFDGALREIKAGKKKGHWSWYFFPVAPWVVNGVERGSPQNKQWCLRDKPPNNLRGDDAAQAFLRFEADGVNLREMYMTMMTAVTVQLERGIDPIELVGELDDPKLRASLQLFERVSGNGFDAEVNQLCRRAMSALGEDPDSGQKSRMCCLCCW